LWHSTNDRPAYQAEKYRERKTNKCLHFGEREGEPTAKCTVLIFYFYFLKKRGQ
jgi:hypothetical protein